MKLGKIPNGKDIKPSKVQNAKNVNQLDHSRTGKLKNVVKRKPRSFEKCAQHLQHMLINVSNNCSTEMEKPGKADAVMPRINQGDY